MPPRFRQQGAVMATLGFGSIVVDCGRTNLVWTNVGYHVTLQRTVDLANWSNVLDVIWLEKPTNALHFAIPIQQLSDREFFRLFSYR